MLRASLYARQVCSLGERRKDVYELHDGVNPRGGVSDAGNVNYQGGPEGQVEV